MRVQSNSKSKELARSHRVEINPRTRFHLVRAEELFCFEEERQLDHNLASYGWSGNSVSGFRVDLFGNPAVCLRAVSVQAELY